MEKTIVIDGKEVKFKSTGAIPKRYKAQFGRDFFADLFSMESVIKKKNVTADDIRKINFDVFYDMAWTLAKTADHAIPDPLTWLDTFESFPIIEIMPELQEMLAATIATQKK